MLRRATAADTEALVAFNADIHRDPGDEGHSPFMAAWVRDLMSGAHPTFDVGDFTIVEDTRTGVIVTSLNLISQIWSYAGVPFGVGCIELVGTRPDHRRRGLVRRQMAVAHRWSAERGEVIQGITGIPLDYRRFGYERAVDHEGGRTGYLPDIPDLASDGVEPFRLRPATGTDTPFIAALDEQARSRSLVSAVRDASLWHYELEGRLEERYRSALCVVERVDGRPAGYVVHARELWRTRLFVEAFEMELGVSWLAATPTVLRYLRTTGKPIRSSPAPVTLKDSPSVSAPTTRSTARFPTGSPARTCPTHGTCGCRISRGSCATSHPFSRRGSPLRWRRGTPPRSSLVSTEAASASSSSMGAWLT